MIDLDQLAELEAKATPAPWHLAVGLDGDESMAMIEHGSFDVGECTNEDASLIAAIRNALPHLITELRAARAELKAARRLIEVVTALHIPLTAAIEAYEQAN